MSIRKLLWLITLGLFVLAAANVFAQYWQGQSQRALISEVSKAQLVGSATSEAMAACAELTPRAMVWTLTRRNTQGKAFEASKAAWRPG